VKVNIDFTLREGSKLLPGPPAKALKLPANYRLVWDVLREAGPGTHLTANEIFVRARERRPRIGFSTVHRGLARLRRLGLALKIDLPGADAASYESVAPAHAHFWCGACGAIRDVDYRLPKRVVRELAARDGVEIDGESLTLTGRCRSCAPKRRVR
jgi:Fe2+ or Zn2+ uptake regulation protein